MTHSSISTSTAHVINQRSIRHITTVYTNLYSISQDLKFHLILLCFGQIGIILLYGLPSCLVFISSFVILLVFVRFSHCNFYFYIVFVSQIVIVLTERSAIVLVFVFVFVTKIAVHTAILCQCDVTQQCERKLASSSSTENSGVVPTIRWLKANEHGHVNR